MATLISIIIPVRNEEAYIAACLSSVLEFTLPLGVDIEILVMEGRSGDRTPELVREFARAHSCVRLIDNPGRIQSTAVTLGAQSSGGAWIMRLDAHAVYPCNYLQLCYETALRSGADNVGGVFITEPGGQGYSAQLVQALSTHMFGVGNSGFRTGAKEGWADTVPYGFYRREVFENIGFLDERLVRGQDYEFNRRLIATGGQIFRNPDIQIHYFNQPSLSAFYRKQFFLEAPYNAYMWYLAPYAFAWRHAITGIFTLGFLGGITLGPIYPRLIGIPFVAVIVLYTALSILAAIQQAIRYKEPLHIFSLPLAFFLYHFVHGLGLLTGVLRLATLTAPVQKIKEPWFGAGRLRAWPVNQKS